MKNSIVALTQKESKEISGGGLKEGVLLGIYAISPFIAFTVAIGGYLLLTTARRAAV